MSSYFIDLDWKRVTPEFTYETYNRHHTIALSGNQIVKNSASPEYLGNADMTNPEELLGSALASCHMMSFLAVASKTGYTVDSYKCKAEAILEKNTEGRMAVTTINLSPVIVFSGEKIPSDEELTKLHERAHRGCFIAQSLKTKVNVL